MSGTVVRRACTALAAVAVLPAVILAQGFEYSAGTSRYKITQSNLVAQEVMGQKQEFETSSNQVVTVNITRPKKDTLMMAISLDSISSQTPMGPAPGLDRLAGLKVDARLSPLGAVYSSSPPSDTTIPNATSIAENMSRFLPRVRARLVKGATWSDTTKGKVNQGGIDVQRNTVSRYTVEGDTVVAGERSWKIVRQDSTTMSGSGVAQGQAMTMEGSSTGKGALFVSPGGVFVGAQGEEVANFKLVLSANGMEIGITQNSSTKVERVK